MVPPIGVNNIKASYRKGDGVAGNLEAFSITKLYSDLKYIDAVYNPIASEGGSEAESPEEMLEWAPAKFKNRGRAVTEEDIVYLAREASEKVAKVKVLSGLDEEGNSDPGLITIIIVPDFPEPRPTHTDEIKQIVQAYLKERAPNTATLKIVDPVYREVNVTVSLVSTNFETVSEIENRVKTKIEEFLHPLKGGKKGKGWDFGQFPSKLDFYFLFSHLNGVSVETINITIKAENEVSKKSPEALELHSSCELALPCNGEHTINVSFPK
jgi:predicted phage baseplate assembly protein